jgi:hypothetical protein
MFVCGARWHCVCEGTARARRVAAVRREAAEAEAASAAEEAQRARKRAHATVSASGRGHTMALGARARQPA